jgi:hypothetical protein
MQSQRVKQTSQGRVSGAPESHQMKLEEQIELEQQKMYQQ